MAAEIADAQRLAEAARDGGHTDDDAPVLTAILSAAAEIARAMNHTYVVVEHLFVAMAHDPEAVPTQVLAQFVSADEVAASLRELMASAGYATAAARPAR